MKDQFIGDKGPLIFYEIRGGLVEIGGRGACEKEWPLRAGHPKK